MVRWRRFAALMVAAASLWCCQVYDSSLLRRSPASGGAGDAGGATGGSAGVGGASGGAGGATGGAGGASGGAGGAGGATGGAGGATGGAGGATGGSAGAGGATGGSAGAGGSGVVVTYDRASSAQLTATNSLSWKQTVSGSNDALLVEIAVGIPNDIGCKVTVTDNATAMTKLAFVHAGNMTVGYLVVFGLAGVTIGSNSIAANVSCTYGTPNELTGGAISFDGVNQSSPFGTPVTNFGSSNLATATTSGSTVGDLIAGFVAGGNSISSAVAPSSLCYLANENSDTGAGNSAGATSPATGSAVTMSWLMGSDHWGVVVVEVKHAP